MESPSRPPSRSPHRWYSRTNATNAAELDGKILTVDIIQLAQPLLKGSEDGRRAGVHGDTICPPVHLPHLLPLGSEPRGEETAAECTAAGPAIAGASATALILMVCSGRLLLPDVPVNFTALVRSPPGLT